MSLVDRLESLRTKHRNLDSAVQVEYRRPLPDNVILKKLKMEKLRVKEEMDRIGTA